MFRSTICSRWNAVTGRRTFAVTDTIQKSMNYGRDKIADTLRVTFRENFVGVLHVVAIGTMMNVSIQAFRYYKKLEEFEAEYLQLKSFHERFNTVFSDDDLMNGIENEIRESKVKGNLRTILLEKIFPGDDSALSASTATKLGDLTSDGKSELM